jgi:hypothetical protein
MMTKKEVCDLLNISPKTLQRRMSKGQYTFSRTGEGQYAELSFTFADIGLPEPTPAAPEPTPALETAPAAPTVEPTPEPTFAPSPLGTIELARQADERFADDFRRGEATDSLGNKIDGTNKLWPNKGAQSLVGSADMYDNLDGTPTETQTHMNPALIGAPDASNTPRHSFDKGMDDAAYEQSMRDWRRRGGGLSGSQQREAVERSKAVINDAFNHARRQR